MEEKLDTIIALLTEVRDALCVPEQEEIPEGGRCPCVRANGVAIGNCPFCRGGG